MQYDDGQDDIAALTFSGFGQSGADGDGEDVQAFVFAVDKDDSGEGSVIDDMRSWAPTQVENAASEVDAIRAQVNAADDADGDDEDDEEEFFATVSNPSGSVAVMALMDGSLVQLRLSPKAANMAESALAEEILTLADLARQKGLALQREMVSDFVRGVNFSGDSDLNADLAESVLEGLPTTEQAAASQAEVFVTRYGAGAD
jgi:hypothetical protein